MSLLAGIHHLGRYSRVKIFFQIKVKTNTEVVICRKFKQTNKKKPVFKMKSNSFFNMMWSEESPIEANPTTGFSVGGGEVKELSRVKAQWTSPGPKTKGCFCSVRTAWLRWAVRVNTAPATTGINSCAASSSRILKQKDKPQWWRIWALQSQSLGPKPFLKLKFLLLHGANSNKIPTSQA